MCEIVYLVSLSQAINSPHLALLVGVRYNALGVVPLVLDYGIHKLILIFRFDVFTEFSKKSRGPFVLHFRSLLVQFPLTPLLLFRGHLLVVCLVVFPLLSLRRKRGLGWMIMGREG